MAYTALPRYRIVDNERVCWYWFSMFKLDCIDLKTKAPYKKTSYTQKDYEAKFGLPFQLTRKRRQVMVRGLIWEQHYNQWTLARGSQAKLVLSDMEFHGLYSKHPFFKNKGVVGSLALCNSIYNGRAFSCKMPWNDTVRMSRSKFVKFFVKRRTNKYGVSSKCKGLYNSDLFWNTDGTLWRCWNYHFWPTSPDSPDSGVWNYYHFSKKFGDFTYILEEQPDTFVNECDYDIQKSDLIERKVWNCDAVKISNQRKNATIDKIDRWQPDYIPRNKNNRFYLHWRLKRYKNFPPIVGPNGTIT